jgi:hypothetical protein
MVSGLFHCGTRRARPNYSPPYMALGDILERIPLA